MKTYTFKVRSVKVPQIVVRADSLTQADIMAREELDEIYMTNDWEAPVGWDITLLSAEADELSGESWEKETSAALKCKEYEAAKGSYLIATKLIDRSIGDFTTFCDGWMARKNWAERALDFSQERAAFEFKESEAGRDGYKTWNVDKGEYDDETTNRAWEAWLARACVIWADGSDNTRVKPDLSFVALYEASAARQHEWHTGGMPDLSYRGNELAGEVGEACNVIKKLERERFNWVGSRDTVEHLAEELGDVLMCVVSTAFTAGISAEDLVRATIEKFNSTSEKFGFKQKLGMK